MQRNQSYNNAAMIVPYTPMDHVPNPICAKYTFRFLVKVLYLNFGQRNSRSPFYCVPFSQFFAITEHFSVVPIKGNICSRISSKE